MKSTKTEKYKEKKQESSPNKPKEKIELIAKVNKKHNWKTSLIFLFLCVPLYFYFSFGLKHIDQFETADEYRWIYDSESRIPKYWKAMLSKDWAHTNINDKPGVSTAIVSGLGYWYIGEDALGQRFVERNKYTFISNPEAIKNIDFAFRFPLLVFNGLFPILWYFLIRRLTENNWLALFACSFTFLSPILIGISQIVNPDTLLWSTAFTAILFFLLFLKSCKWHDGFLFGLFLGFALLSKYAAVVIIPYAFCLMIAYLVYKYNYFIKENIFRKRVIQYFLSFPFMVASSFLIYSLLMPFVFYNPKFLLDGNEAFKGMKDYYILMSQISAIFLLDAIFLKSWILKKGFYYIKYLWSIGSRVFFGSLLFMFSLESWNWSRLNVLNIPEIPYDTGLGKEFTSLSLIHKIFLEIHPLVFSTVPLVLFLMLITWLIYIFKKERSFAFSVFAASFFLPVFYAAVIKQDLLVHVRYSILLYPPVCFIAAVGLVEILNWFKFRFNFILKIVVFALLIWIMVLSLDFIKPFYFNYTNSLLPKNYIINSAWGYGGYEAAQILNKSEHPENLIIWTDYGGVCPFFPGTCIGDSDIKWVGYKTVNDIDYYVVTARGLKQFKRVWRNLSLNTSKKPVWRLEIGNRPDNFIEIYKVEKSEYTNNNWWRN